ncbi:MAG TPA: fumarylacetoacetate hydrolase family protein [Stellaceae bacterium]|jgi:2-keto-4-pentenoate hydratase/2-oxohepta-3-ene-1,7-dioic acid hydratase in catechol pathway
MSAKPDLADFALGTFSVAGAPPFAGLVIDGRVIAVGTESVLQMLQHWDDSLPILRKLAVAFRASADIRAQSAPLEMLRVHPPVDLPRNVYCAGMNYRKHVIDLIMSQSGTSDEPGLSGADRRAAAEKTMDMRAASGEPFVFIKSTSAIVGANDPVTLPDGVTRPDWELELGVVIGRPARHVARKDALNYVAGYAVANDVTARDRINHKEMRFDWLKGKSQPSFLPFGPYLVPAAFVRDPQDLRLTLTLNGKIMQDESSADMIYGVARLIEYLSAHVQLLPGDLICTGSPAGNGAHYNRFLQPGDVMEASIDGLGTQHNPCVAEIKSGV